MNEPVRMGGAAAAWLVGRLDDRCLVTFLRGLGPAVQGLTRGFQLAVSSSGLPTIRRRLALATAADAHLAGHLLAAPGMPWSERRNALLKQPAATVRQNWRLLARDAESGGTVLLALATYPDARLAARARRMLRRDAAWPQPPAASAPPVPRPESRGAETHERERSAAWRRRLAALEAEFNEERARWRQERRDLEQQAAAAGQELAALQNRVAAEVAAGVQAYRRDTLGLTPELIAATAPAAAETTAALLARVADALERQRQIDERHARREALRSEITDLEAARSRLGTARRDSAVILPELEPLDRELTARADLLRRQLDGDDLLRGSQVAALFVRETGAVPVNTTGILRLEELQKWLHLEPLRTLLSAAERDALSALVTRRQAELRRLAIAQAVATDAASRPAPGLSEIGNLGRALLAAPVPPLLLVDACNVLLVLPEYAAIATTRMAGERPRLCRLCQAKSTGLAGIELIYDGQGAVATRENKGSGVVEVFAAHRGEDQNADDYIVRRVADLADDLRSPPVWLVTADHGLRDRAVAAGCAALVSPAAFQAFFED